MEVLTTSDAQHWQEVLEITKPYDFYHLPAFHRLAEDNGEGEAIMPVFTEDGHTIAFPMLFRMIECPYGRTGATRYRDASCIYGFAGPLTSSAEVPEHIRVRFTESLQAFYEDHDVVSAFCRLHPLIVHSELFADYGNIVEIGATTSIDLTVPPEEQVRRYRRNHRQDIEHLRREGYTCTQVGPDHLDQFVSIYLDTMNRVNADRAYYFGRPYFEQMMRDMSDIIHLFACKSANGDVASVALCAVCNGIIQVHLAGTAEAHRKFAPMKLVFDTIREWGNQIGARIVHLGGGVGSRRDSLYQFKMGFGSREHIFCTWQHVVNREVYNRLCSDAIRNAQAEPEGHYFPEYRNPCLRPYGPSVDATQYPAYRRSVQMPRVIKEDIYTTNDAAPWRSVLQEMGSYDFYHLPEFHRLTENRGDGTAVMQVLRSGDYTMAFPMLLRKIDIPSKSSAEPQWMDATSVPGFAGPLVSHPVLPDDVKLDFINGINDFFVRSRVVSAYSRLNPLTCWSPVLDGYGTITEIGPTLSVDLTVPPEIQWAKYRRNHKRVMRRLEQEGYVCEEAGTDCLDDIVNIYHQTMTRVGADPAFFYDKAYFSYLLTEMPGTMGLVVCRAQDTLTSFILYSACGGIVASYLGGTADDFVEAAPSRLLYDSLRRMGNKIGAKALHLGGGVGGRRDHLYEFKVGFGATEHTYSTWKLIVDHSAYDSICDEMRRITGSSPDDSYFPAYRNPEILRMIPGRDLVKWSKETR